MHIFLTLTILPTKIYYFLISQFIKYSITYFWVGVELGIGLGVELGVGLGGLGLELGLEHFLHPSIKKSMSSSRLKEKISGIADTTFGIPPYLANFASESPIVRET